MPLDSSEEDVRGPESTALEIGGIPGQFEKTRDHLRQLKTYTLDLQEAVQFLNLDPTQSRQSLRHDRGNYDLITQNTRSVLLNNTFGFVNSTKPERCVWRSAEGSFFDEIGRLKNVVSTFVALGSEKSTQEILQKLGLGLDETLKFGPNSEVVHEIHGTLKRITLETPRGQTHWDIHPDSQLVMRLSTDYSPPTAPESVRIRRTIECTWKFPNELDPQIIFDPGDRIKYPTIEALFTWENPKSGSSPNGGMPGDLFPTVELNSFSGQPWSSKSIVGQDHLYLFWNSPNSPSRLFIRSLQGLSNNPKGCDMTCINVAEPGAIDAERWQKASETFASLRVSTVRSLFDPSSNLYSGLQVTELP
ncbi:MAG: hypothetical protein AAFO91_16620, partial [Bacteroidota bacterium]